MTPFSFDRVGPYVGGGIANQDSMQGFLMANREAAASHRLRVAEAARLLADCISGREDPVFMREALFPRHPALVSHLMGNYPRLYAGRALRETMSSTDYQSLYVDVIDRLYYGYYNAYPVVAQQLAKKKPLRDFRIVKRYMLDGVVSPLTKMGDPAAPPDQRALLGPAPQQGAVPPTPATSTAATEYQPDLYQSMTSVNWRAFVNDDLGIFNDLAERLAISGRMGIDKFITEFFLDANGPHASLYTSGYKNIINIANGAASNNPAFSSQGVMDAMKILAGMRDSLGNPIMITGRMKVFYPPALTAVAQNLKRALQITVATEGGVLSSANFPAQWMNVENWLNDMDLVMLPWAPIVASSAHGNTSWGIVVDPNTQNRPCVEVGYLNGFDTPQLYSKLPNTQRLGGGTDPMLGDFYTMDQDLKACVVMGGAQIDGRSTVASNGSGS